MTFTRALVLAAAVLIVVSGQTPRNVKGGPNVNCPCSPTNRGYRSEIAEDLLNDANDLDIYNKEMERENIAPQERNRLLGIRSKEFWDNCVNNYRMEECVNADTAVRGQKGCYPNCLSFCRYNRGNWFNTVNGQNAPGCNTRPAWTSQDPEIIAGRYPQDVSRTTANPNPNARNNNNNNNNNVAVPPGRPNQNSRPNQINQNNNQNNNQNPNGNNQGPAPGRPVTPITSNNEDVSEESPVPEVRNEGSVCFPSTATVELFNGSTKTMDKVELGDKLLVSSGTYSEVFMFTHKLQNVQYEFFDLKTRAGVLSLTSDHYIYVNGNLVAAKTAKVGDTLESSNGDVVTIESISTKVRTGLFNPQTVHGDIVVDGIRTSTYTTVAAPKAAHAMLAPLRSLYMRFGGITTAMLDAGCDVLAKGVSAIVA